MASFRTLAPCLATAALAACAARGPILVAQVTATERGCDIAVADRHFDLRPGSEDELEAFLHAWPGRRADIRAESDAPYRCLGGLIFGLQRAHFRALTFNGMRLDDPRLREGFDRNRLEGRSPRLR